MSHHEDKVMEKPSFWKDPHPMPNLPGRVMKQTSSECSASTSYELFTASCADAWDSQLDDSPRARAIMSNKTSSSATSIGSEGSSTGSSNVTNTGNNLPLDNQRVKAAKFEQILSNETINLNDLRTIAWSGIPIRYRPITWKLLLGYLPHQRSKQTSVVEKKRAEYEQFVDLYYNNKRCADDEVWHQIHIDIPRMQPLISIFQQDVVQKMFERILYIYSIRHPASGYVQGMNDLVIPFFVVYLSEYIPNAGTLDKLESFEVNSLPDSVLRSVEADAFWSLNKLLDSIQDNYTFDQPGIQQLVGLLEKLVSRIEPELHAHLTCHNVQYLLFSFRWMNNLLIREIPLGRIIRLWDTYFSEGALTTSTSAMDKSSSGAATSTASSLGDGSPFSSSFHLYVCAAFLCKWSKSLLKEKDFQGLILFLQNLPTFHWTDKDIEGLVSHAYLLKEIFTKNHLHS